VYVLWKQEHASTIDKITRYSYDQVHVVLEILYHMLCLPRP